VPAAGIREPGPQALGRPSCLRGVTTVRSAWPAYPAVPARPPGRVGRSLATAGPAGD